MVFFPSSLLNLAAVCAALTRGAQRTAASGVLLEAAAIPIIAPVARSCAERLGLSRTTPQSKMKKPEFVRPAS